MGQKASFTTHYLPLSAGWLRRSGTVWREEMNKRIKTGINVHSNCFLIRWSLTENHHLPMRSFFLNWFLTNLRWNDLVLCGKTLWTISFKSHLAWNECHDHIHTVLHTHIDSSFWHHKRQNVHALIERKWRKRIENSIIFKNKFLMSVQ